MEANKFSFLSPPTRNRSVIVIVTHKKNSISLIRLSHHILFRVPLILPTKSRPRVVAMRSVWAPPPRRANPMQRCCIPWLCHGMSLTAQRLVAGPFDTNERIFLNLQQWRGDRFLSDQPPCFEQIPQNYKNKFFNYHHISWRVSCANTAASGLLSLALDFCMTAINWCSRAESQIILNYTHYNFVLTK